MPRMVSKLDHRPTARAVDFCYTRGWWYSKSLARQGRKQATANKLGMYSTYSPRSSINFLARYSNFWKPLKKNSESYPSNQFSAAAMTSASEKNGHLSFVFSVQGTGGSPTGPEPENRVGDQDSGSPGRPLSSGLQEQDPLGKFPAAFFPLKCPSIAPEEMNNTPCW